MVFRAPVTRAARAVLCGALAGFIGWVIHVEIGFFVFDPTLRVVTLVPTCVLELALLVGLWRLWVVGLIVDDSGVTVRNFRGDLQLRRTEIRGAFASLNMTGCHVGLRLKVGDEIHLDGLAFATPRRTNRAVREISDALGVTPLDR